MRKRIFHPICWLMVFGFTLLSCSPGDQAVETPGSSPSPAELEVASATAPPPSPTPDLTPSPQPEPPPLPLAAPGPFWIGRTSFVVSDESRGNREIKVSICYPALKEVDAENHVITVDARPDSSGGPYPILLTGPNTATYLLCTHLASHGFIVVAVRPPDFRYEDPWNPLIVDAPLDFIAVLQHLPEMLPGSVLEVADLERVGAAGYSWDGFFSLGVSGVRIDPENYLAHCREVDALHPDLSQSMKDYYCGFAADWEEFIGQLDPSLTESEDGLWQPITDPRILAAMPMAPDGAWLYGERGLANVEIPVLIITGTSDTIAPYWMESVTIYENLVNADRRLISFVGQNHMMVFNNEQANRMRHFATAFFGCYLQGRADYAYFISEEYVSEFPDLAWGVFGDQ